MTVLGSAKIDDGLVRAADSATSFANGMVYHQADKIVNLRGGLPVAAMVTGAGGIGAESIDTLCSRTCTWRASWSRPPSASCASR